MKKEHRMVIEAALAVGMVMAITNTYIYTIKHLQTLLTVIGLDGHLVIR